VPLQLYKTLSAVGTGRVKLADSPAWFRIGERLPTLVIPAVWQMTSASNLANLVTNYVPLAAKRGGRGRTKIPAPCAKVDRLQCNVTEDICGNDEIWRGVGDFRRHAGQ
jgi:hypothetical protein